ncbi:reverse transcriptase domain-containing protein [Tanacetum coccineum]
MTSVTMAWPFIKWSIDIISPLPEAPGKMKFLIVAIDYFTKWVEAKPLTSITRKHVKRFVWEHIVCRFRIPQMVVSDNEKQFEERVFPQFCENLKIKQTFNFVYHPKSRRLTKVTNKEIIKGMEKRLGRAHKGWVEELLQLLWAHRTSPKGSNGETLFSLTYETEAMLPMEISIPTKRTKKVEPAKDKNDLRINFELLEERREIAANREAAF